MRRTLMQVFWVLILAFLQPSCGGGRSALPPSAPRPPAPLLDRADADALRTLRISYLAIWKSGNNPGHACGAIELDSRSFWRRSGPSCHMG